MYLYISRKFRQPSLQNSNALFTTGTHTHYYIVADRLVFYVIHSQVIDLTHLKGYSCVVLLVQWAVLFKWYERVETTSIGNDNT